MNDIIMVSDKLEIKRPDKFVFPFMEMTKLYFHILLSNVTGHLNFSSLSKEDTLKCFFNSNLNSMWKTYIIYKYLLSLLFISLHCELLPFFLRFLI